MNLHSNKHKTEPSLGWRFLLVGLLWAALLAWRGKTHLAVFLGASTILIRLLAFFHPPSGKWLYRLGTGLGNGIGSVISHLALMLIYYFAVTPVALLFRIMRRDVLKIKRNPDPLSSYWTDHENIQDKTYYDHLY